MDFVLRTERLILRPFQEEDAPALNRISNQELIWQRMPDWKMTLEETERLIRYFTLQYPLATKSTAKVVLAVTLTGCVIGMVGIANKEECGNEIEIAYFISQEHTGNGYGAEAAGAVCQWALANLGMAYLIAIVEPDNIPSQRIVEKCGFEKVDTRMILNSGDTREKPFFYYRLYNR